MGGDCKLLRLITAAKRLAADHPGTAWGIGIGVGTWLVLILALWIVPGGIPSARPWLELANGATWPSDEWKGMAGCSPFWFAATVGTRTALNFSAPLAVIGALIWFFSGGLERYMQMTLIEMLRMHNTELISRLLFLLQARKIEVPPEVADELHEAARKFLDEWQPELKNVKKE